MEGITEDLLNIHNLLPWIDSTEYIDLMQRIRLVDSHLKNSLAIYYFLKSKDRKGTDFEQKIEDDAREIAIMLPEMNDKVIKARLTVLGNMPDRKEVVLRQLLYDRQDLARLVEEIDDVAIKKRKATDSLVENLDSSNETNIKIRKVEGTLEVVSSTKQEKSPKSLKVGPDSIGSRPSPVIVGNENDDLCPELPNPKSSKVCSSNKHENVSVHISESSTSKENRNNPRLSRTTVNVDSNNSSNISGREDFDLIEYLKVVTGASAEKIISVCKKFNVSNFGKRDEVILNDLLNNILGVDATDVSASESSSSDSSDTEEYFSSPNRTINVIEPENAIPTNIQTIAKMETSVPAVDIQEAGTSNAPLSKKRVLDEQLVLRLIEMFPEACPDYIRDVCDGRQWSEFDDIITVILSADSYPKRPERRPSPNVEVDLEEQLEIVKALLPDADPTYLRLKCEQIGNNPEQLNEFINQARESKSYPTMKEYLRKQQLSAQSKQYTTEFKVENFVELFPHPKETFNHPKRNVQLDNYARFYISTYFENKFDRLHKKSISRILDSNNFKILACNNAMLMAMKKKEIMKSRRKQVELPDHGQNILLLQELAYLTHKEEINDYIRVTKQREKEERQYAKENGLMNTCQCCFDDEIMSNATFYCPKSCMFCKECIQKSCEVALGDGRTDFKCLNDCPEEFTLQTLQNVLPPRMFSKLAQKKALAEIRAAEIEELEMCPFCDFASIPNETDKIFRCLNPDCMKESCRSCKEPNHIPLKCDELEKDQHVKARTHVENKMTEALLRKCWKCGTSFFKEEGCNKMTCTCGANMCYICKKPVRDYTHFNGIGGDKYHLCPLYSDTNLINQQNVIRAAKTAKAEVGPSNLKVDPSVGIQEHYEKRKKILPREPHMEVLPHELLGMRHLERQRRPPQ